MNDKSDFHENDLVVQEVENTEGLDNSQTFISMPRSKSQIHQAYNPQNFQVNMSESRTGILKHQSSTASFHKSITNTHNKSVSRISALTIGNISFNEGDSRINLLADNKENLDVSRSFDQRADTDDFMLTNTSPLKKPLTEECTFRPSFMIDSPKIELWRVRARKNWAKARRILKTHRSYGILLCNNIVD